MPEELIEGAYLVRVEPADWHCVTKQVSSDKSRLACVFEVPDGSLRIVRLQRMSDHQMQGEWWGHVPEFSESIVGTREDADRLAREFTG